ncbi:MAG: nitroreductase [Pseudorhodobacter sp.]|nr:nitroreductase [Pseudorhodobacter sp.]
MPDPMPATANPAALDFLLTRRSRPTRSLTAPGPSRDQLTRVLTAAARSPDHGKLEPWRFIVLARPALLRLAALAERRATELGMDPGLAAKGCGQFVESPLAVAVVSHPVASEKVPQIEQVLSSAAVCLGLLNAALASGWGACWLTGWPAYDRGFLAEGLGLADGEAVSGFIHIGTQTAQPPERPRPDINALTTWVVA